MATVGCSTAQKKKLEAHYGPSESVLEVVATLRRHVPDDTYRFPPATDFTGRNVYLSTLLRLESIERMHAENPGGSVVIQADKDSKNGLLVQVMDAARLAGVSNVSLAAEVVEGMGE